MFQILSEAAPELGGIGEKDPLPLLEQEIPHDAASKVWPGPRLP